jgi:hypothetical protein
MNKRDAPTGAHSVVHNPGYDFLRLAHWMEEADPDSPSLPFAPYLITTIAVLAACCAIEGYVNMVGKKVDSDWDQFDRGPVPIKDRLSRIYDHAGKQIDFSQGIWQQVLELFRIRVSLVHPRYMEKTQRRTTEIQDVFDLVKSKSSPGKARATAENAVDALLADTNLADMRELYISRGYHGPPRESG